MRNNGLDIRSVLLFIFGVLFALGDAIFVIFLYNWFSDDILYGNGAVLGVFVSLVVVGVLFPSILFIIVLYLLWSGGKP